MTWVTKQSLVFCLLFLLSKLFERGECVVAVGVVTECSKN